MHLFPVHWNSSASRFLYVFDFCSKYLLKSFSLNILDSLGEWASMAAISSGEIYSFFMADCSQESEAIDKLGIRMAKMIRHRIFFIKCEILVLFKPFY